LDRWLPLRRGSFPTTACRRRRTTLEDVAFNVSQGHSGCLGVASADLDGNGVADYVLSWRRCNPRPLAVIAPARGAQWVFAIRRGRHHARLTSTSCHPPLIATAGAAACGGRPGD
jgi:hypothetical protein